MGLIGTVQRALALVFAVPVALLGLDFLLGGQTLVGGAFVVVAVLMVVLEEYLTTPSDVPAEAAERVTDRLVGRDE